MKPEGFTAQRIKLRTTEPNPNSVIRWDIRILSPQAKPADSPWALHLRPAPRWEYRASDDALAERLRTECGLSPMVARVYAARGMTSQNEITAFTEPALADTHDPMLLLGMEAAIDRIERAVRAKEPIWIYGDYDVDGVTSTATLKCAFDFLKYPVNTYIPHRLDEGYGLRKEAVRTLAGRGAKLIITVDNGTTAVEEVALANSLGVDVVVTDHHEPGAEGMPEAFALINPKQPGCTYPFKDLCGVGVAFKVAHALLRKMSPNPAAAKEFLKSLLDFVALGTVADVVSMTGENRCFVTHGMRLLRSGGRPCFRTMFEIIGTNVETMEAGSLGYTLAPRLNAAGRTDRAEIALELLLASDPTRTRELSVMLNNFNDDRRRIEGDITEEALSLIDEDSDSPIIVVDQEGWHLGVVGIVASRILERYHRPTIVLGVDNGSAKGSARSIRGFDIHAALGACSEYLDQFGGHTMAAGLRLKSDKIPAFRKAICEYTRALITPADLVPVLRIDARATADDLTRNAVESLEALGPFGPGNAKPMIHVEGLSLVEEPRILKERHLKLHLTGQDGTSFHAIGFSMAERAPELRMGTSAMHIVGTPTINHWRGSSRVEFEMKDLRVDA